MRDCLLSGVSDCAGKSWVRAPLASFILLSCQYVGRGANHGPSALCRRDEKEDLDMEKPKPGDIIEIIGGTCNGIRYKIVDPPRNRKNQDPHTIWCMRIPPYESETVGYFNSDIQYRIIERGTTPTARTYPDFDQRMREKTNNNLRNIFT